MEDANGGSLTVNACTHMPSFVLTRIMSFGAARRSGSAEVRYSSIR